jgi:hypothetical protein
MTASEALDVVRCGNLRSFTLWRDPEEPVYVLSAPRDEGRYYEQGWIEMATVAELREHSEKICNPGVRSDLTIWILLTDVEKEQEAIG